MSKENNDLELARAALRPGAVRSTLLELWQRQPKTILFVTHDIEEAIFLSDRIYVMSARPGRIKAEIAVPLLRPRTLDATTDPAFVALKRQIFELIREESVKAISDQGDPR